MGDWRRILITIIGGVVAITALAEGTLGPTRFVETGGLDYTPLSSALSPQHGAFNPRVELSVLPARGGFVPDLAIRYSSNLNNGYLGAGWSFEFTSKVSRKGQSGGVPQFDGDYDSTDIYMADGMELIAVANGIFRPEIDNFSEFSQNELGWKMESGGSKRYFGLYESAQNSSGDSVLACGTIGEIEYQREFQPGAPGDSFGPETSPSESICQARPVSWLLASSEDSFGNRITYKYRVDHGVHYPSTITYNKHDSDNLNRIDFEYADRSDIRVSYRDGAERKLAERLTGIKVYSLREGVETLVYEYGFSYRLSNSDKQSLLTKITQIADGESRILHTFDYADVSNSDSVAWKEDEEISVDRDLISQSWQNELNDPDSEKSIDTFTLLTDVNSDSRPDMLVFNSLCRWVVIDPDDGGSGNSNEGSGPSHPGAELSEPRPIAYEDCLSDHKVFLNTPQSQSLIGELAPKFAIDNLTPDLRGSPRANSEKARAAKSGVTAVAPAKTQAVSSETAAAKTNPNSPANRRLGAARSNNLIITNGDPLLDKKRLIGNAFSFVFNQDLSSQFNDFFGSIRLAGGKRVEFDIIDLNLDGFVDLVKSSGGGLVRMGTQDGWQGEVSQPWVHTRYYGNYQFVDINGDGYPDLVGQSGYYLNHAAATGSSFFAVTIDEPVQIDDPLLLSSSGAFGSPDEDCMQSNDDARVAVFTLGRVSFTNGSGTPYYSGLDTADRISPEQWVWQNTSHADVNGDGIVDRIINVEWLERHSEGGGILSGSTPTWDYSYNDQCGMHDSVYLGDGRGGFFDAGYGLGGSRTRATVSTSIDVKPNKIIRYTFRLNHFSLVDLDRSGRGELIQFCNEYELSGLYNQGLAGYGINTAQDSCPSDAIAGIPVPFSGLDPSTSVYGGMIDLDADGMPDGFQSFNPYVTNDTYNSDVLQATFSSKSTVPKWSRNLRKVAQNKLISMAGSYGGATTIEWSTSAKNSGNQIPVNLDVVSALTGENGRTTYKYIDAAYGDSRFLGFGEVESSSSTGAKTVNTYYQGVAFGGAPRTTQRYDGEGKLHTLTVFVNGINGPAAFPFDPFKPYYNPLIRRCDFEIGRVFKTIMKNDISDYVQMCDEFEDEAELPDNCKGKFDCLRPHESLDLDQLVLKREVLDRDLTELLVGDRKTIRNRPGISKNQVTETKKLASPSRAVSLQRTRAPEKSKTQLDSLVSAWEKASNSFSAKLVYTQQARADFEKSTNPEVRQGLIETLPGVMLNQYRMYVTEWDYDYSNGTNTEIRELKDVSTRYDSTVEEMAYLTPSGNYNGYRLQSYTIRDRLGNTSLSRQFSNYNKSEWKSVTETGSNGATRSRIRRFTPYGEVSSETDWNGHVTTYQFDGCGTITRSQVDKPAIIYTQSETDNYCRTISRSTSSGSEEALEYNGFHQLTHSTLTSKTSKQLISEHWLARDFRQVAAPGNPAIVEVHRVDENTLSAEMTYIDAYARPWRWVTCQTECEDPDQCRNNWTISLEDTFACDLAAGMPTETVTGRSSATGQVRFQSSPFDARDLADGVSVDSVNAGSGILNFDPHVLGAPGVWTEYDALSRPAKNIFADGSELTFAYALGSQTQTDANGLSTVNRTDTVSQSITVNGDTQMEAEMNAFGQMVRERDALGQQTDYEFDDFGRVKKTLLPRTDVLASCDSMLQSQRPELSFSYDDNGNLLTETDANGHGKTYEYDEIGRVSRVLGDDGITVLRSTQYFDRLPPLRRKVTTDALGNSKTDWLNVMDQPWRSVGYDGSVSQLFYDHLGRVAKRVAPWGEITEYTRDHNGQVVMSSTNMGVLSATTTITRDARGKVLEETDPDGVVSSHEYDVMGRLTASWLGNNREVVSEQYEYDAVGRIIQETINGIATHYELDAFGRQVKTESGYISQGDALETTLHNYDQLGNVVSRENANGRIDRFVYDSRGLVVESEVAGVVLTKDYDAAGNTLRVTRAATGLSDCRAYDDENRLVFITPAGLGSTVISYARNAPHPVSGDISSLRTDVQSPSGEVTSVFTDSKGREWSTLAADGSGQLAEYHSELLTRQTRFDNSGALIVQKDLFYDENSSRVAMERDWYAPVNIALCASAVSFSDDNCSSGAVRTEYTPGGRIASFMDQQGNVTAYQRRLDGTGLLDSVEMGGLSHAESSPEQALPLRMEYKYVSQLSLLEKLLEMVDGSQISTAYEYQRNARLTSVAREKSGESTEQIKYRHDNVGNRVGAARFVDGVLQTRIIDTYDINDRLASREHRILSQAMNPIAWSYNPDATLQSITYPSGNVVEYAYDGATGLLSSVSYQGNPVFAVTARDSAGRVLNHGLAGSAAVTAAFSNGRLDQRTVQGLLADSYTETYGYDGLGRLDSIEAGTDTDGTIQRTFGYEERGYVVADNRSGPQASSTAYIYNRAGQRELKTISPANGPPVTINFTHAPGNRLDSVNGTNIEWDQFGRQSTDQRAQRFTFGLDHRLRKMETADGVEISMLHDPDGKRVARRFGRAYPDTYLSGPARLLHHQSPTGNSADLVFLPSGQLVGILNNDSSGTAMHSVFNDAMGSPILISDNGTSTVKEFGAYGETDSVDGFQIGFQGMWSSGADGINVAGLRAYDPDSGRFVSRDPLNFASGADIGQAADLYRYALNNPVAYADPGGAAPFAVVDGMVMDDWMYEGFMAADPNDSYVSSVLGFYQDNAGVSFTYGQLAPWGMSGEMQWDPDNGWQVWEAEGGKSASEVHRQTFLGDRIIKSIFGDSFDALDSTEALAGISETFAQQRKQQNRDARRAQREEKQALRQERRERKKAVNYMVRQMNKEERATFKRRKKLAMAAADAAWQDRQKSFTGPAGDSRAIRKASERIAVAAYILDIKSESPEVQNIIKSIFGVEVGSPEYDHVVQKIKFMNEAIEKGGMMNPAAGSWQPIRVERFTSLQAAGRVFMRFDPNWHQNAQGDWNAIVDSAGNEIYFPQPLPGTLIPVMNMGTDISPIQLNHGAGASTAVHELVHLVLNGGVDVYIRDGARYAATPASTRMINADSYMTAINALYSQASTNVILWVNSPYRP